MSQPEDERGHDGLTSAERIEQMTRPIQEWWPAMRSTREAELEAQVEALQQRLEHVERTIDEEMVACHIGVFNREDDPKKALNSLMVWSQGVGEYFAKEKVEALQRENERLKAPVSDEECRRFEACYGEKLMLGFVDVGLQYFIENRATQPASQEGKHGQADQQEPPMA